MYFDQLSGAAGTQKEIHKKHLKREKRLKTAEKSVSHPKTGRNTQQTRKFEIFVRFAIVFKKINRHPQTGLTVMMRSPLKKNYSLSLNYY